MARGDGELPRVGVVVASLGRAEILGALLCDLARQTLIPKRIVLSVTTEADLPMDWNQYPNVDAIVVPKGSCVQRNRGIDHIGRTCDVIFFCDDDYVPSQFTIERLAALFAANPNVAGATGHLLADGVNSAGISTTAARAMLAAAPRTMP
jgi:hypothetical protein